MLVCRMIGKAIIGQLADFIEVIAVHDDNFGSIRQIGNNLIR